jgi:hypothetical protein
LYTLYKLLHMSKTKRIIYWVATVWLALGMTVTGALQIMRHEEEVQMMSRLGYLPYFLLIIGTWKLLGVVAVLMPRLPLLKEWAYAGFFFAMSGAIVSHLAVGDGATELFGPSLLLLLTIVSWYGRPAERKCVSLSNAWYGPKS